MTTGRGNALLEDTHFVSQVGLVTHSRRHTTEKGRHFRTCLGETEDVVNEEQNVLLLNVTEVFRHGQSRQCYTKTGSWGLIHLAEDEGGLVEDACFFHFVDKVVTFTGTLTNTGEYRYTTVVLSYTLNHFLNQNGLTHTGSTEQTNLSTLNVGGQEVDNLDTGFEQLSLGLELVECRWGAVDGPALLDFNLFARCSVEDVTGDVENLTLGDVTNRHGDRSTGVGDFLTAHEAVSWLERNSANQVVTEVLSNLKHKLGRLGADGDGGLKGVVDAGDRVVWELDVDNGTGNAGDATDCGLRLGCLRSCCLFSRCCLCGGLSLSSWCCCHCSSSLLPGLESLCYLADDKASAPPTISEICCVISD